MVVFVTNLLKNAGKRTSKVSRWWFQIFFIFTPIWGNDLNLTHIFQLGWFNHQLGMFKKKNLHPKNPWTLQWKGWNLHNRGLGPQISHWIVGSGFLGHLSCTRIAWNCVGSFWSCVRELTQGENTPASVHPSQLVHPRSLT